MLWLFMRLNGWLAVIPLALGAGIIFVGTQISERAALLESEGVDGTATVIAKREFERRSTTNNTTTTYYNLRYHFPLGDGTLHYDDRDVSHSFYDSVESGGQVPVRFLTADPDIHEIESGAISDNALAASLIGAVLVLSGLLTLVLLGRKAMRMAAVRGHGERAEAVVESIQLNPIANRVVFTFTDREGTDRKEMSIGGRAWRIAGIETGDSIPIRYDPQHPRRAYREADLGL